MDSIPSSSSSSVTQSPNTQPFSVSSVPTQSQQAPATPNKNSKFKLSLILIIVFILICLGIGTFLLVSKQNVLTIFLNQRAGSTNSIPQSKTDSSINNSQKSVLQNKVIFVNQGKLFISDLDGKNTKSFNKDLDKFSLVGTDTSALLTSPDRKYRLIGGYDQNLNLLVAKYHYFVLSIADRTFQEIDLNKIASQFNYSQYPTVMGPFFWHWTDDSRYLVYSAENHPENLPGKVRRAIGLYDVTTREAKEIYSEEADKTQSYPSYWGVIYYDQNSNQVAYTDDDVATLAEANPFTNPNRMEGRLVELNTHQKTQFKGFNMLSASRPIGKYGLVVTPDDPCNRKQITIYPAIKPNNSVAQVQLPSNENTNYDHYIFWSSDYNLFTVHTFTCYEKIKDQFWFYSKDGKLMAKVDVPIIGLNVIISPDNKQAIIWGNEGKSSEDKRITWRLVNLGKDNDVVSTVPSQDLGQIIYWY